MVEKVNGHRHAAMPDMHARRGREGTTLTGRGRGEAVVMFNGVLEQLDAQLRRVRRGRGRVVPGTGDTDTPSRGRVPRDRTRAGK